jgi:hypothetical protein
MIHGAAKHRHALRVSSMLTTSFRRMHQPGAALVRPEKVIRVLHAAGVRFVVMGTHGIGGYRSEPRATQDVDILVAARDHRKAIAAIREAYPKLVLQEAKVGTRFADPRTGNVVIDLMRPYFALYKRALRTAVAIDDDYRVPSLEMALASKYAAMTSLNRPPDKNTSTPAISSISSATIATRSIAPN